MAFRRTALALLVVGILAVACSGGGDGESASVSLDDPIGAPEDGTDYQGASSSSSSSVDPGPSVIKNASVAMEVVGDELNSAAQSVIDLATSAKVGGFLVSSVVDLDSDNGSGNIVVKVPATRFETVVGDLGSIGDVRRQELSGQDLTAEFLDTHARLRQARQRTSNLLTRLERSEDPAVRFELREDIRAGKNELRTLQKDESFLDLSTTFSTIDVSLIGKEAPAPPEKPAFVRALATAKSISLAIASGAVLTLGVVVPIGLLALLLYFLGAPVIRRIKPRLERADGF